MTRSWLRLARLLVQLDRRVAALEEGKTEMANDFERLATDVADLTTQEQGAETRVAAMAAEVSTLNDEIAQFKANVPGLDPAQLAGIEAVTARLAALAQPQEPAPAETPAPAPAPESTTTTATAVPGQSTFDGTPVPATDQGAGPTQP